MSPTLSALIQVLNELDEACLSSVYNIRRDSDAPLDVAFFAWRDFVNDGLKNENCNACVFDRGETCEAYAPNVSHEIEEAVAAWSVINCDDNGRANPGATGCPGFKARE